MTDHAVDRGQGRDENGTVRKSDRIIEGLCPTCATPLQRQADCGWCVRCDLGWSITKSGKTSTISMHVAPHVPGITCGGNR